MKLLDRLILPRETRNLKKINKIAKEIDEMIARRGKYWDHKENNTLIALSFSKLLNIKTVEHAWKVELYVLILKLRLWPK